MILYEYAYWGDEIIVREVECEKVGDRYIGVGVARSEEQLGKLIGSHNIYLMHLTTRDDLKFMRALIARIGGVLVECIEQTNKLNAAIETYMKKMRGGADDQV